MPKPLTPFAIYGPKGQLNYIGPHLNEQEVWTVYLGWPHPDEIAVKKQAGWTCLPVLIRPCEKSVPKRGFF